MRKPKNQAKHWPNLQNWKIPMPPSCAIQHTNCVTPWITGNPPQTICFFLGWPPAPLHLLSSFWEFQFCFSVKVLAHGSSHQFVLIFVGEVGQFLGTYPCRLSNVCIFHVNKKITSIDQFGGTVASWVVRLTSDQAVWVQTMVGDIALCSWARHFTLTVPLSTQVYKWVPANLMLGVALWRTSIPSRWE